MNLKSTRNQDGDDDLELGKKLKYWVEVGQAPKIVRVNITTDVDEPSFYDEIFQVISNLDECDAVIYTINSNGGYLSGLAMLLEANAMTEAKTIAHIVGACHSAASILAMSCDEVLVGDYAEMLVHSARFGAGGKVADTQAHVAHNVKYTEQIFREFYAGFLTEEEIVAVLEGKEHYMLPEEIRDRLESKAAFMHELYKSLED